MALWTEESCSVFFFPLQKKESCCKDSSSCSLRLTLNRTRLSVYCLRRTLTPCHPLNLLSLLSVIRHCASLSSTMLACFCQTVSAHWPALWLHVFLSFYHTYNHICLYGCTHPRHVSVPGRFWWWLHKEHTPTHTHPGLRQHIGMLAAMCAYTDGLQVHVQYSPVWLFQAIWNGSGKSPESMFSHPCTVWFLFRPAYQNLFLKVALFSPRIMSHILDLFITAILFSFLEGQLACVAVLSPALNCFKNRICFKVMFLGIMIQKFYKINQPLLSFLIWLILAL